jgi:membrane-bound metal-dependent hydrolase YbcI (DUF457 family)
MPFTPFHFGPGAAIALPLYRRLDLPVFLLVNVFVDLEPLAVMLLGLPFPLHGTTHTLLGAAVIGAAWALVAWKIRRPLAWSMHLVGLPYDPGLGRMIVSSVLGAWLHVFLDAPLYGDIRPFFPSEANPLLGAVPASAEYAVCAALFVPALIIYVVVVSGRRR